MLSFEEKVSMRAENLTFIDNEKYKNPKVFEGFLVNCEAGFPHQKK
jgi:hypothetical protein